MVDFNQPETIASTPEDLVKKIILESLIFVEDSIEAYNRKAFKGYTPDVYEVKARLTTLFNKLSPALKEELNSFDKLKEKVKSDEFEDLLSVYNILNAWVYKKQLTNVFKKKVIL